MDTITISRQQAASTRIVFEGKTKVGRTYRVTVDEAAGLIHFYRTFDFEPDVWHSEGTVRHDAADWLAAFNAHMCHDGDGLVYISN